jgi:hypothetical protein
MARAEGVNFLILTWLHFFRRDISGSIYSGFVHRFLVRIGTLAWKMAQSETITLACLVEELAAYARFQQARVVHELETDAPDQMWFSHIFLLL